MKHSALQALLDPIEKLFEDVRRKAKMRLEYEGKKGAVSNDKKIFLKHCCYSVRVNA